MKAAKSRSIAPYRPLYAIDPDEIYICRLAPYAHILNPNVIFRSQDCKKWVKVEELLDIRDSQPDPKLEGFRYPSFVLDGDSILRLSRTAINCPDNSHDSNYTTFHVIKKFRKL